MIHDHHFDDYRDKRVLVMGLGSFGGGTGAVKFLVSRGAIVTVTDLRPAEKLAESLAELRETPPQRLALGGHHETDFRGADLVVANPAVNRDCQFLQSAIRAGVPVTSEMNLFWKWNRAPVIGVTGSNGKSTTTAMIHAILKQSFLQQPDRTVWLGGNIGTSLLPVVEQIKPRDLVVLELSSFQLLDLNRLEVSPHVAVVTNFAPNHLDWHPDLDHYRHSKQSIVRWQSAGDFAVLNDDDQDVGQWPIVGTRLGFGLHDRGQCGAFWRTENAVIRLSSGEQHFPLKQWVKLPGQHNLANALAAIAATSSLSVSTASVQTALENYKPLPHRLEFVGELDGRRFYNDSLATTPESTEVALEAFEAPIVLLAGGYDKHVDLTKMAQAIARRAKAVALMGQTASVLRQSISATPKNHCVLSPSLQSFEAAFEWALKHSLAGDVILLSPGCASYDWFRNFADRGMQFTELVRRHIESAGQS